MTRCILQLEECTKEQVAWPIVQHHDTCSAPLAAPPPIPCTYDLGHLSRSSRQSRSVTIQPSPGKKSLLYSSSGAEALIRDSFPAERPPGVTDTSRARARTRHGHGYVTDTSRIRHGHGHGHGYVTDVRVGRDDDQSTLTLQLAMLFGIHSPNETANAGGSSVGGVCEAEKMQLAESSCGLC